MSRPTRTGKGDERWVALGDGDDVMIDLEAEERATQKKANKNIDRIDKMFEPTLPPRSNTPSPNPETDGEGGAKEQQRHQQQQGGEEAKAAGFKNKAKEAGNKLKDGFRNFFSSPKAPEAPK
jgi:hypothetical protein